MFAPRTFKRLDVAMSWPLGKVNPFFLEGFAGVQWNCSQRYEHPYNRRPFIQAVKLDDDSKYWSVVQNIDHTLMHFMRPVNLHVFGCGHDRVSADTPYLLTRAWIRQRKALPPPSPPQLPIGSTVPDTIDLDDLQISIRLKRSSPAPVIPEPPPILDVLLMLEGTNASPSPHNPSTCELWYALDTHAWYPTEKHWDALRHTGQITQEFVCDSQKDGTLKPYMTLLDDKGQVLM